MPIVVIGLSHRTCPVELRERFAFAEPKIPEAIQKLRAEGVAEEAVIVSTCNRVEIYAASASASGQTLEALQQFLVDWCAYRGPLIDEIYRLNEPDSVEHLFQVACGLDSLVLGETEILGQLKKSYDLALQHKHTGSRLNKAFQRAFNVAKQIRTETNIQRGSVSVGSVAVELAEKIFSSLADRQVMVLGAGDTSEKAARALLSRGARSIIVSNRSFDRAETLAKELHGRAVHFDQWSQEFAQIDIIVSSTSAPHYLLDRAKLEPAMELRGNEPLLLIDLAVPRNIDPEANFLENVYLYNVDDLQGIADDYLEQRKEELARCQAIIREKAQALLGARHRPGLASGRHPAFGHE